MGLGKAFDAIKQARELQKILRDVEVEVGAGGGAVRLRMNGLQEIIEIVIEERVIDPTKAKKLADMIKQAVNEANKKAQVAAAQEMRQRGMGMPGM
jgi:DNA-binding YbaB/EbfC family protein